MKRTISLSTCLYSKAYHLHASLYGYIPDLQKIDWDFPPRFS